MTNLSLGIWGGYLSDRIVCEGSSSQQPLQLRTSNSWYNRLLSFVCLSTQSYTDENRRSLALFKTYVTDRIGTERFERICQRMGISFDEMMSRGRALYSRDVVKILVGARDVHMEDVQGLLAGLQRGERWTQGISPNLRQALFRVNHFSQMPAQTFSQVMNHLEGPFQNLPACARIQQPITGMHTECSANYWYDPFTAAREKLQLCESNPLLSREEFYEKLAKRISKKEMNVGALLPAYAQLDGRIVYYRISAKLITGKGMVSYTLVAATVDTDLACLRVFRGTELRPGAIDSSGFAYTDLERDLGRTAYESGQTYEPAHRLLHVRPIDVEIGHSIGGTLVQLRSSDLPTRSLHIYNAPGVSLPTVEKFREKVAGQNQPVSLHIHETKGDKIQRLGGYNIGYQAPPSVRVDYKKYYPLGFTAAAPHSLYFNQSEVERFSVRGNYSREQLDKKFDHTRKGLLEPFRRIVGGYFLAPIVYLISAISRLIFGARAEQLKGLWVEMPSTTQYTIARITEAMARNNQLPALAPAG